MDLKYAHLRNFFNGLVEFYQKLNEQDFGMIKFVQDVAEIMPQYEV